MDKLDKRRLRPINSRKKIIQSAKILFTEFGYKEVTMITMHAQIGYGTAHTQEDIFLAIMEEIIDQFHYVADMAYI